MRSLLHSPHSRTRSIAAATLGALALIGSLLVAAPAHALNDTGTGGVFVPASGTILDTKNNIGGYSTPMPAKAWRTVKVTGVAGLPDDGSVGALSVVATAADIAAQGQLFGRPDASTSQTLMGIYGGENKDNTSFSSVLAVSSDGTVQVYAETSIRLILGVQGYYTANTDGTAPGGFVPLNGKRVADSRSGTGIPKAQLTSGKSATLQVTGTAGIPAGASAVIVNLIALNSTSNVGYLTPYATGATRPVNAFNYAGDVITTMQAQVPLSADGKITIYNANSTIDLAIDVQGYFTAAGGSGAAFTPGQGRIVDTRTTGGNLAGNETRAYDVAGKAGVPVMGSGINAVVITLTGIATNGGGWGRVWANGATEPDTASLRYEDDTIRTNTITVPLGANGKISLHNIGAGATNFIIDVQGWYTNPQSPSIGCPTPYGDGSWSDSIPTSLSCSITAPIASGSGQYVEISTPAGIQDVDLSATGTTATTVSFTPAGGENGIFATVVDQDGNVVSENDYTVGFGNWAASSLLTAPDAGAHVTLPAALSITPAGDSVFLDDATFSFTVASDAAMQNVVWTSTGSASTVTVPEGALSAGSTYYWTAKVVGATSWSSSQATVTTTPQAIATDGIPAQLTTDQESDLRSRMSSLGIDADTQTALVAKVDAGMPLDSSRTDATAIDSVTNTDADGQVSTTLIYADGSRALKTLDAAAVSTPQGVQVRSTKKGCKKSAGWYINCTIGVYDPISSASFVIDYKTSSSKKAQVRDIRQIKCVAMWGASCTRSGSIKRGTQSSKGPAWAAESYTYKSPLNVVQGGTDFGIRVSGTSVSLY